VNKILKALIYIYIYTHTYQHIKNIEMACIHLSVFDHSGTGSVYMKGIMLISILNL